MTYRGRVRNGVIILEPPANLPEGAGVDVTPTGEAVIPSLYERLKDIVGVADDLPSDSSDNHDHYLYGLYGAPKK